MEMGNVLGSGKERTKREGAGWGRERGEVGVERRDEEDQGQAVVSNARMADQVFGLRLLCNRLHRPLSRATGFSDCHLLISAPLQLKVEKSRRNQILILSYSRSSASSIDR